MNKRILQAFSAGMIVSTSILTLTFYLGNYDQKVVAEKELTDKSVNEYLAQNNKIAVSNKEYEEFLSYKDTKVKNLNKTPQQNEQQQKQQNQNAQNQNAQNQNQEQKNNNQQTEVKPVKVNIKEGMTTSDVSKILEQSGIIDSASKFNQYLIKHDYHKRVQIGTFEVKKGMSYYEIAEALTR
ncbi:MULTISPECIES: endolytic transglycosylase MltG [Aeribacillus]|jgi:hypothetical protein|uniref:Uncharacterized protein n=3 Tax=Aeribacillus TaxID=1055323 RepID=A0A164B021_9BACI|nr:MULTISPECIES: endolytic transglycosylase MltG [Aeribacillus]REJ25354.1 MAG: hypothetical protein C6W54_04330 [Bacillaceae bacterium]ASS91917.1 hypothetical protein AP3564_18160 [Aeribacillus pallidus]KZM56791.1 hypothetical protein A3Q35_07040 [Aeribacillus pallidus]MDR9795757.1 endolytic transglycosylase MltG [Aeribacillus pallidus]MED0649686.1 endolytic transglycosylase MltG [Aeribacillus composti]